jgi:HK97 family phage portal protein
MSVWAKRALGDSNSELIPTRRTTQVGSVSVSPDTALRTSAVWASLRLRANMISTMPLDVFRKVDGRAVNVTTPPVLVNPGGEYVDIIEWLYSTQIDLDRTGNAYGIISAKDGAGKPARIDLVDPSTVTVKVDAAGIVTYKIGKNPVPFARADVWHERQFTLSGFVMGLSPVAYAAYTIGQYQSALQFGLDWFANGATVPGGHFKNTQKILSASESATAKTRYKEAVANRDVIVTGSDWEFSTVSVAQNESQFLDTQKVSLSDIARFFDVPGDLIDVAPLGKSAVTYANITQRNLQFLILSLGPVFTRRETSLSRIVSNPRYVKFNTDAMLRMDPDTRNNMFIAQVAGKIRTPSEVRELDNLPPFTAAQIEEFKVLGTITAPVPVTAQPLNEGQAA